MGSADGTLASLGIGTTEPATTAVFGVGAIELRASGIQIGTGDAGLRKAFQKKPIVRLLQSEHRNGRNKRSSRGQ